VAEVPHDFHQALQTSALMVLSSFLVVTTELREKGSMEGVVGVALFLKKELKRRRKSHLNSQLLLD